MIWNVNVLIVVNKLSTYYKSFIDLLFPRCCVVCGKPLMRSEEFLCTSCNMNLPRTNYHLLPDNPIERLFWDKVKLEIATSYYYYYRGGEMRKIIHEMKYAKKKEIGAVMGRQMAAELRPSGFFDGIDLLMPVVLHKKKQRDRGFNQSEWIAKGISAITKLPIEMTAVKRVKHVETQTQKTPYQRYENVQHIFELEHPERIKGKHVLVIDDVLTTGATATAFMESFAEVEGIKISLLTLAVAAQ